MGLVCLAAKYSSPIYVSWLMLPQTEFKGWFLGFFSLFCFGFFPMFCSVFLWLGCLLLKKDFNIRKIISSPWTTKSTEEWVEYMRCCRGSSVTCFSHCILTFSYIGSPRHAIDFVLLRCLSGVWKHFLEQNYFISDMQNEHLTCRSTHRLWPQEPSNQLSI